MSDTHVKTNFSFLDIVNRNPVPIPWQEGENIPWNDPGFSARMLKEHLSQAHDAASRRIKKIEQQVEWIHTEILKNVPTKILDLGCGPGFYTSRLADKGHLCKGIDYSPASIAYASAYAADQDDQSRTHHSYFLDDIRNASFGAGFGLVMLIYGEVNVFTQHDIDIILKKIHRALEPKGKLLLELQTEESIERRGLQTPTWYSTPIGLFSDKPHLVLTENHWNEKSRTATERFYVIDAGTGRIQSYASTTKAYSEVEINSLLEKHGFCHIQKFPSLIGGPDETQQDFYGIVATKE